MKGNKHTQSFNEHVKYMQQDQITSVSPNSTNAPVVRSASEHFKAVLQTLKHNKVMVKTEADGIYVRMAGDDSKGECFSLEWGKVVSF